MRFRASFELTSILSDMLNMTEPMKQAHTLCASCADELLSGPSRWFQPEDPISRRLRKAMIKLSQFTLVPHRSIQSRTGLESQSWLLQRRLSIPLASDFPVLVQFPPHPTTLTYKLPPLLTSLHTTSPLTPHRRPHHTTPLPQAHGPQQDHKLPT